MYDELIKRLIEEARSWCINCCYLAGDCICAAPDDRKKGCDIASKLQAADAIEELSKPRWIPVTERLPGIDDGDWVLGVVNGFAYGIVYKNAIVTVEYYENSGCWSLHDLDAKVTVTHWMPLPEPPEEVTNDA